MPGLTYPSAPRMGRVNLPSVSSPTPRMRRFRYSPYFRMSSPEVRSPWLHAYPATIQPIDDYNFASSPDTPHLPNLCSLFDNTPDIENVDASNALGLIFDPPLIDYQPPTPTSPPSTLFTITPHVFVTHPPSPDTYVLQGNSHQHGGQGGNQPFLVNTNSQIGDAQASPPLEQQDTNNIVPDDMTAGAHQEIGPVEGGNVIAAARSVLQGIEEKQEEGKAVSFSILAAVVSMLEQKMSTRKLSGDDIDILDVIASFHDS